MGLGGNKMKQLAFTHYKYQLLALVFFLFLALIGCAGVTAPDDAGNDEVSLVTLTAEALTQSSPTSLATTTAPRPSVEPSTEPTATLTPSATPTRRTPVPRGTPEAFQTAEMQLTKMVRPSETPRPPFATPEVALICEQGEEFTSCEDLILGITFEYSNQWGNLTSSLSEGGYAGYAYNYVFDSGVTAGGRSRDFSEGRGRILTDFYGFSGPIENTVCTWPRYQPNAICQEIKPNVVFLVSLPDADEFCDYSFGGPLTAVALEIPHNDFINGFVFIGSALDEERRTELTNSFGPRESETWPQCDEANKKAYNQRAREMAHELEDSLINGNPDPSLVTLLRLAESITFK